MLFRDVKQQIFNLGFETEQGYTEDASIIADSINRAMREISNLFPIVGEYKLMHTPLPNLLSQSAAHYSAQALNYSAKGAKSLYFEVSGGGRLTITDEDGTRALELQAGAYRRFVKGDVTLTFDGQYSYDITNLALYGEIFSANEGDIPPYGKYARYDFKELTKERDEVGGDRYVFIDFLEKVRQSDGSYSKTRDFCIEKRHVLVLDGSEKAQYTFFYKKNFVPVTEATDDAFNIEIDFDKEHLLPLLAAWYVWADDEPTKAAKWRNDYEDFAAKLLAQAKPGAAQEQFINKLGW